MKKSFLRFEPWEQKPDRKTKRWWVFSTATDPVKLGEIKWYPKWRKYCFFPEEAIFDESCLVEIGEFVTRETSAHKLKNKESI